MTKKEIKEALESSKNDTISSRAEEIIFNVFNEEDRKEMVIDLSFNTIVNRQSSTVEKDYSNNSIPYFLSDIESFEDMWGTYDPEIGFYEEINESGIHWSLILDIKDGDRTMQQVVDFNIWIDLEDSED